MNKLSSAAVDSIAMKMACGSIILFIMFGSIEYLKHGLREDPSGWIAVAFIMILSCMTLSLALMAMAIIIRRFEER